MYAKNIRSSVKYEIQTERSATQWVSKPKDLMKIPKVIFQIKLIPSHLWWECKNLYGWNRNRKYIENLVQVVDMDDLGQSLNWNSLKLI